MNDEQSVAELPLEGVGARLVRARDAQGLTRAQLAGITKIPERHLAAIEAGDFSALPARTYAVGFSRSYARAVGLDEKTIADEVRRELSEREPSEFRRAAPAFEPGDPARIPSARFAWIAAFVAMLAVVAALIYWRGDGPAELPSLLPAEAPSAAAPSPLPSQSALADDPALLAPGPATPPDVTSRNAQALEPRPGTRQQPADRPVTTQNLPVEAVPVPDASAASTTATTAADR